MELRMRSGSHCAHCRAVRRSGACTQHGFSYLLLMIAIAAISTLTAASVQSGAVASRRQAERALLFVGGEYGRALRSYTGSAAGAAGPRSLEELLKDPRTPGLRRHLRKIYADPLTGSTQWGLLKDPAGRITGIYSLAPGEPIQRTGFAPEHIYFADASSYAQWVFGMPMRGMNAQPLKRGVVEPPGGKP
jgi:type II secretory pathway pseudopilin PulG